MQLHIDWSGGGGLCHRLLQFLGTDILAKMCIRDRAGLEGMAIDTVGSRHSSLLAIMSAGASRVMREEELMKVVRTKMPSYYQEEMCIRDRVNTSFCKFILELLPAICDFQCIIDGIVNLVFGPLRIAPVSYTHLA